MRPRPVLILAALMAALSALAGAGAALDFLPRVVVAALLLANVAVAAAGGVIVQGSVTPLSAPQNADGTALVPADILTAHVRLAAAMGAQEGAREAATGGNLEG